MEVVLSVLLDVRNLHTYYFTLAGTVKAVDNVSFHLKEGNIMGLAGESACGKTTTALSLMRLVPWPGKVVDGAIYLDGEEILGKSDTEIRKIRWMKIAVVFQSAMNALNPVKRIGGQIAEAIKIHNPEMDKTDIDERIHDLFEMVRMDPSRASNYPHEFSGGMKQRTMIAMALANHPKVLIADEPTTALDVVVQAQILKLIDQLKKEMRLSMIVVSHDLSILAETCDTITIMYAGKLVEDGPVSVLFSEPAHPYSTGMINSFPSLSRDRTVRLMSIPGTPPDLISPPKGCRFAPRCPQVMAQCRVEEPQIIEIGKDHRVACHLYP